MKPGDSVAVNGVCLTVKEFDRGGFRVEAVEETIANSTVRTWKVGRRLNLERALRVGDRLGGHIVQGHIDAVGKVARLRWGTGSAEIHIDAPLQVMKLLPLKGSVAVDGTSLTIAGKHTRGFKLTIVPFTLEHTNLGDLKPGDLVNLETDLIIRWLADRFPGGEFSDSDGQLNAGFGLIHLED